MGTDQQAHPSHASQRSKEVIFSLVDIVISSYALVQLLLPKIMHLDERTVHLIGRIDLAICGYFLIDFGIRFARAPSKRAYMKWGWLDLLSAIPASEAFRYARLARLLRIVRLFRVMRSGQRLSTSFVDSGVAGVFHTVAIAFFLTLCAGTVAILEMETTPEARISTVQEAFWWSLVTMTTVGYGDYYPVTLGGRIVAAVLMTVGVGLFGVLSGGLAATLFAGTSRTDEPPAPTAPNALDTRLADMEQRLDEVLRELRALRAEPRPPG